MRRPMWAAIAAASISVGAFPGRTVGQVFLRGQVAGGMIWTDSSGIPFDGAVSLALGWPLGNPLLRQEQNLLFGPFASIRYARLRGNAPDVQGLGGLMLSGRILRTAIPIDVLWSVDGAFGTYRIPFGVALGAGYRQEVAGLLRFAWDFKHSDPALEFVVTLPLVTIGGEPKPPACPPPDLGDTRTHAGLVAQSSYSSQATRHALPKLRPPAQLDSTVTNLAQFAAAMRRQVPDELLTQSQLEAFAHPAGADWDRRETWVAVLRGWNERVRISRCEGP
jgi:hypothetical protein